ncbi:Transcription factor TCP18 [Morella rubra]|uniref:Transcription factor TCP18 n=1 Tax=Morella rubra TaxID=262757 RepID=A0A6A1VID3_9ROSI|nr:Transcription factor TCP18 [Morella rubra]
MYPSNSCNIGNDPIYYPYHPFQRPFLNDISISSPKQAGDPSLVSFYGHFPSPFEDDDVLLQKYHEQILHQQTIMRPDNNITGAVANMVESNTYHINGERVAEQIPRKRSSKRDRHSKINTARGPRDRRMRLSLDVARKFFGLQDMLRFDKASKTVEWLLIQAKAEIKKLAREVKCSGSVGACKSASSTSECEVVSGSDQVAIYNGNHRGSVSEEKPSSFAAKEKKTRQWRRIAFHPLARESREKARARARERTREKNRRRLDQKKLNDQEVTANCDLSRFGSWSPFETGEESGTQSQNINPSWELQPEVEERSSHERNHDLGAAEDMVNDDALVTIGRWSPSPVVFNYSLNHTGIPQEHQFGDYQFLGKPWEAGNNHSLY